MALRIRFPYSTGSSLGYSVERLGDGSFFDFADGTFKATPITLIAPLPEDSGNFLGRYKVTLASTPVSQFSDGRYAITVHNQKASNAVVGELAATLRNGDDSPEVSSIDPWSVSIPGAYPAGTAGAILGQNLDAQVSTRSTYAGGIVAGISAPVTVGTITDKSGYSLAASGLDAISVEAGINARQALAPILAASAGVVAGAGTGVVVIKGGNSLITRITATTDNLGNRSSVTLTIPS